jgi:serine protease AprX
MTLKPALFTIAVLIYTSSLCGAKLSPDLKSRKHKDKNVDVLVQFSQLPSKSVLARITGKGGLKKSAMLHGKVGLFTLPQAAVDALENDPSVVFASPDRAVGLSLDSARPAVAADIAQQYGWTGVGVGVAIIDSGISPDTDFGSRIVYSENFVPGEPTTTDLYGHGTHVAGIVGGNGAGSSCTTCIRSLKGIAPGVSLINLRVLNSQGQGTDSAVINAIDRAIALKNTYNIRVINLSIGRPIKESYQFDPLCQAAERAWKAGIVVVVAAGNSGRDDSKGTKGYASIGSPANDPYVITVGAMHDKGSSSRGDDQIATYSSKGPTPLDHIAKPDLVAPGNRVVSVLPRNLATATMLAKYPANAVKLNYYMNTSSPYYSPDYFQLSGTSMAGGAGCQWRSCRDHPEGSNGNSGHSKSSANEDGDKELSDRQHLHGPGYSRDVHESIRSVHGGRGICQRLGSAQQFRCCEHGQVRTFTEGAAGYSKREGRCG